MLFARQFLTHVMQQTCWQGISTGSPNDPLQTAQLSAPYLCYKHNKLHIGKSKRIDRLKLSFLEKISDHLTLRKGNVSLFSTKDICFLSSVSLSSTEDIITKFSGINLSLQQHEFHRTFSKAHCKSLKTCFMKTFNPWMKLLYLLRFKIT